MSAGGESWASRYFAELERYAWQSYEQAKALYHVSAAKPDNWLRMIVDGIRPKPGGWGIDDGPAIWFFTDERWAAEVAASIGLQDFALFRIRKSAIKRELIRWDNVAERCAAVSFYCLQSHIPKSYVRWMGNYSVVLTPSQMAAAEQALAGQGQQGGEP